MDQEDESDEDKQFLDFAMEIIDEYAKGGEVSPLMKYLKKPTHSLNSETNNCIYKALKFIENISQRGSRKSFTIPPRSSSPDCHNYQNGFYGLVIIKFSERTLCLSPTKQVGINNIEDVQEINGRTVQEVPRLSLDFSPSVSIYRSPLSSTDMAADISRYSSLRYSTHCCKKCFTQSGALNMSDFLYLIIFGLGASVMFYYLYYPTLYKDPVF